MSQCLVGAFRLSSCTALLQHQCPPVKVYDFSLRYAEVFPEKKPPKANIGRPGKLKSEHWLSDPDQHFGQVQHLAVFFKKK